VPSCQLGRWEPVLSERGFSIGQDLVVSQYPEEVRYKQKSGMQRKRVG
jgi:hypothetical protein